MDVERLLSRFGWFKLRQAWRAFTQTGLRWSYLAAIALALVGLALQLMLTNGWWVWPMVIVVWVLCSIQEASQRNLDGVAPMQAYALFGAVLFVWLFVAIVLRWAGPIVLVAAPAIMYYAVHIFLANRRKMELRKTRRIEGRCIHCGLPDAAQYVLCPSCGNDPGLSSAISKLEKLTSDQRERMRQALKPADHGAVAAGKEQALLSRRRRK